jgi:hypothetical protein
MYMKISKIFLFFPSARQQISAASVQSQLKKCKLNPTLVSFSKVPTKTQLNTKYFQIYNLNPTLTKTFFSSRRLLGWYWVEFYLNRPPQKTTTTASGIFLTSLPPNNSYQRKFNTANMPIDGLEHIYPPPQKNNFIIYIREAN